MIDLKIAITRVKPNAKAQAIKWNQAANTFAVKQGLGIYWS